ncbi:GH3 auxin-responsive promoter family protein [Trichothermofontia sp.]
MSNLFFSLLSAVALAVKADFVRKTQRTEQVQTQFLRSLLAAHQHTEFGQKYHLGDIRTIDEFRQRVPIQPYSGFAPYTERIANGEPNLLVAEPVIHMNLSSGSTGNRKLIPVTRRSRQILTWAYLVAAGFACEAARERGVPLGKMLFVSSTRAQGQTAGGIRYNFISNSDVQLLGFLYRQAIAYPYVAFQIADTTARTYVCLLFALRQAHLRIFAATFPVLAIQQANFLAQYAEPLIEDLAKGTIAPWLAIEPSIRRQLERQWIAAPDRAAELRCHLHTTGILTPAQAWPNLSFIITARGGSSDFYFERFPACLGDIPIFGGIYSCAETIFGMHRAFNTDSVALAIASGFYEFIPADQWHLEQPQTLLPWEVKPGERYRIIFTNYSGFYRYDVGDVVEVDGFMGTTPLIIFRYRQGSVLSSTTEKTNEYHVIQVMQTLQQIFQVTLENFCITLSDDRIPAHYLVNIELAAGSTLTDPEQFLLAFDRTLKAVSVLYEVKRRDQVPAPRLRILAPGSFAQLQQRLCDRGVGAAQFKFPHLSEDRQFLAGLEVLQEVRLAEEYAAQGQGAIRQLRPSAS